MRQTSVSRADRLVCPACGHGALRSRGLFSRSADCESCCRAFDDVTVGTLEQIAALPEAQGEHACECGHPEMRSLAGRDVPLPRLPIGGGGCRISLWAVASHAQEKANKEGVL